MFYVNYNVLDYRKQFMLNLFDVDYGNLFLGADPVQTVFFFKERTYGGLFSQWGHLKKLFYIYVNQGINLVYSDSLKSL